MSNVLQILSNNTNSSSADMLINSTAEATKLIDPQNITNIFQPFTSNADALSWITQPSGLVQFFTQIVSAAKQLCGKVVDKIASGIPGGDSILKGVTSVLSGGNSLLGVAEDVVEKAVSKTKDLVSDAASSVSKAAKSVAKKIKSIF